MYIEQWPPEFLSWLQNLRNLLQRQLWRLQDLRDSGGLAIHFFLVTLNQLLFASLPQDSHPALYITTFRVITSDWSEYRHSLGTQKSFLMQLHPTKASFIDLISRHISQMSSCRFWNGFLKDIRAHIMISRALCSSFHSQLIARNPGVPCQGTASYLPVPGPILLVTRVPW